jgi:hypothetical protein
MLNWICCCTLGPKIKLPVGHWGLVDARRRLERGQSRKCGSKNWAVSPPARPGRRSGGGYRLQPVPHQLPALKRLAGCKILDLFFSFFFKVIGIRIRVSEQDHHCLFRSHAASRALNDRLEETRTLPPSCPRSFGVYLGERLESDTCPPLAIFSSARS